MLLMATALGSDQEPALLRHAQSPGAPLTTRSSVPPAFGRAAVNTPPALQIPSRGLAPVFAHWPIVKASPDSVHLALHVPILMYHRVIDPARAGRSLHELVVPPSLFADQMTMLERAGWRTIDTATLAADLALGTRPPPKTFVVTFDDGYADGYTEAYPILRGLGFVATYFIVTGRVGRPDQLKAEDLQALAAAGMEIGDHTVDHLDLARLNGRELRHQVVDAQLSITRTVGESPVSFAYPFGDLNDRATSTVEAAGFAIAVTNREGVGETWANRFAVPRLRVGPGTTPRDLLRRMAPYG
jgi:peptidoglycan/xylan/chitin deacetylase (PgdA/CDA1 family)